MSESHWFHMHIALYFSVIIIWWVLIWSISHVQVCINTCGPWDRLGEWGQGQGLPLLTATLEQLGLSAFLKGISIRPGSQSAFQFIPKLFYGLEVGSVQAIQVLPHQSRPAISLWTSLCARGALSCWNRKASSANCCHEVGAQNRLEYHCML